MARAGGFAAVARLAGGRAAVFHEGTISLAWTIPDPSPRTRIRARFQDLAEIVASALRDLGVVAMIGEVPGEYCPGAYSVNARGRTKLMGVGQRLDRRAAHVGGVIVVSAADRITPVLVPVYAALGLDWDPRTVGSVEDEVTGASIDGVEEALLRRFADLHTLTEGGLSASVLTEARELEPRHRIDAF
jgi:octanoyl-[GcvH]:protein N-octanoyltransferase